MRGFKDKLINKRIRGHGHTLRMNEERTAKMILNMKINENTQEEDHDQDENKRYGKISCRRMEEHGRKLRKSFGKTKADEKA
jgi:hypothetical protein